MRKFIFLLILVACCCCARVAEAQSTIFNYQGRLGANGTPANGLFDFRFTLYKIETNGVILAGPVTNAAVAVSNGLFTTSLDFGNAPFLGVNRWLDIAVRTNGSTTAFTPLTPRIRIASTPYAISAINVIDGAVTASALSPGPGVDGQVLKMSGGVLTWQSDLNSGGTVTSVSAGTGLLGGPITSTGSLAVNPAVVPLLSGNQIFSGSNSFSGVSSLTNANNRFVGSFTGNGAGLSNVTVTATNPVTLAGDVTGPSTATTVGALRGISLSATAPAANQLLRFNGTSWTPGAVALGTDVTGTLADARLSSNVPLLNGNQSFSGSNTFSGVTLLNNANNTLAGNGAGLTSLNAANVSAGTLADARLSGNVALLNRIQTFAATNIFSGVSIVTNANNSLSGTFSGNGTGLTGLNAGNVSAGTLADGRLSANVPLLNGNQLFSGSNSFSGVSLLTNANNRFVGAFIGNGAGLTNLTVTATNPVTLAGDVTGPSSATTVGALRGISLSATAPAANQLLRFNGTSWTPGAVALGTDVTGTLADARLSSNVPLLNGNQSFSGSNTFSGVSLLNNANNTLAGNGAGLTSLNAANVSAGTLADARLSANVALLNRAQTFAATNIFSGVSIVTNANNRFVGAFAGNGAGLSNVTVTATNPVTLSGDVTGLSTATTVGAIRGVSVAAVTPTINQILRYNGSTWTPNQVLLGSDVSGTLADSHLTPNVPLLNGNQTFAGSNSFNGVSAFTNVNNRFVGAFVGNGAGLTNITVTATNSTVTLAGDVTGASGANTLAAIRGVSVAATAPVANQHFRFNGTSWAPGSVALGTDVSGTLSLANGGTAASTAAGARANLGAAASGVNSDITSLAGLTVALGPTQGGSGQSTYTAGDLLYASAANTLSRLPIGTLSQTLAVTNGLPHWGPPNLHDHLGQAWSGVAVDGLFVENTSTNAGSSGVTGSSTNNNGLTYGVFGQSASSSGTGVEGFAFAGTGFTTGVYGEATSTNGTGVTGIGSGVSGSVIGVYGEADSPSGQGVYGLNVVDTGVTVGIYGESYGDSGIGVFGIGSTTATNGVPVGVYGSVSTPNGYGLYTPNKLYVGGAAYIIGPLSAASLNATNFSGSGANLTNLAAGNITSGTLADVRLSANVALLNARQTFTSTNTFSPPAGPPFVVGSTNRVTNLNADLVDGLSGAQFLRSDTSSTQLVGNLSFAATSQLLAATGSVAAPSIAFTTSPNAGFYSPSNTAVAVATGGTERLRVAGDGKVGIARVATTNIFEVEGNASKTVAGSWLANSDVRIKTGIENLQHPLETIDQVRPVSFRYTEEYRAAHPSIEDKRYYNVIAQEFAKVFPDAVKESGETLDGHPILQVDVHPAAIYAIAAIQELHGLVKSKEAELLKLKEQNASLEHRLEQLEKALNVRNP